MADPAYEPGSYWDERLASTGGLRATGHHSYSESYNRWLYRAKGRALSRALARIGPPGRTLDIGSGTGWVIERLLAAGAAVEGSDIAPAAIEALAKTHPGVPLIKADIGAEPLPREDATYRTVTALDVFYHVVDDARWLAALDEVARVLEPGGALIVTDSLGTDDTEPAPHVRMRSESTWRDAAERAGLELEWQTPLYRWLSRDRRRGLLQHLPDRARGPLEYALELAVPRAPHMKMAALRRAGVQAS